MNEEAIKVAYDLFVNDGYNKSIEDFRQLIASNPKALQVSYDLFVKDGYNKDVDSYKNLLGVGGAKFDYQAMPEQEAAPTLGQQVQSGMEQIMPGLQQMREGEEQAILQKKEDDKDAERNAILGAMRKADEAKDYAKDYVKKKAAQEAALQEMGFGQDAATESVSADGSSASGNDFDPSLFDPNILKQKVDISARQDATAAAPRIIEKANERKNYVELENIIAKDEAFNAKQAEEMAVINERDAKKKDEEAKRSSELNRAVNALPAFNTLVNSIDANLIGKEEEDIISRLDFQFGRFGFIFSESGVGDAVTVRTDDGLNGIEVQLDNWSDAQDSAEGEKLKEFIREFSKMPKSIELAKRQENLSPVELEADAFYQSRGLNYFQEQDKWETYTRLRNEIEFIKEGIDEGKSYNEMKIYPDLYAAGELRPDIETYLGSLERQRDGLFESVFDAGFIDEGKIQKTREDFDLHLHKKSEEEAKKAADLNLIAQTNEFDIQTASYEQFGVPAKDLFNITPKNEQEAIALKSLQDGYYSSQVEKDFASRKYDMAKTYFDAKLDKDIVGNYVENFDAFYAQLQGGYANGTAAYPILEMSTGIKDIQDPVQRTIAAAIIAENMRFQAGLVDKQSRVLDRTRSAYGWKEWASSVSADPFEWATSLAAHSISEMLPYGKKIIPAFVATGMAGGAALGLLGGPFAPATVTGGVISGGFLGLRGGVAASGFAMEYTNAIFDAMRNKGYDLTDPAQVEMAIQDEEVWKEGGRVGTLRGIPIATMDLLSAGLAGRVFKVSKLAALPTKIAVRTGERMVLDPAAEAAGELMAQVNAGQEVDWKEIAAEAGGAMGNNSSNMAINLYRDSRNKTNIQFADNLTKIGFLSSENATDTRITSWANNMEKLGKIDADVNQRIQENVGLRREARDILSIGTLGRYVNKNPGTVGRVMELLAARQELSSTTNRRELNRGKITAINDEITAISETRKLLPQEQSVDLSLIIGTTRSGTSQYIIDGKRLTKDEFNYRLGKMSPEKVAKLDSEGKIIIRQDTDAMAAVQDAARGRGSRVNTPDEEKLTSTELDRKAELEETLAARVEDEKNGVTTFDVTDGKGGITKVSYADAQAELDALNEKANAKPENKIETKTTKENAVQKQTTSEVPIQSEAGVSEEVEGGKPTAETQVTTEEGKEEVKEFIPSKIYEKIDEDGFPVVAYTDSETGQTEFEASEKPQISASKTIGGAVTGLFSMLRNMGQSKNKKISIYKIEELPSVEVQPSNIADFAFLEEVRYDNKVGGKKILEINLNDKQVEFLNDFYESFSADEDSYSSLLEKYNVEDRQALEDLFKEKIKSLIPSDEKGFFRAEVTTTEVTPAKEEAPKKRGRKKTAPAVAPQVAPAVSPTVAPAVAPTSEEQVREANRKAKENRGKNINIRDFKRTKKRGQDLKIGDIYTRKIGDSIYVFKVLSKLRKYTGQFYNMDVEVLDIGNDYVQQELDSDKKIKEVGRRVGQKTIDTFKNMSSGTGKFNFGEVTVLENFEVAPEAKTEVAPAPAPAPAVEVVQPTIEVAPAPSPEVTLEEVANQQLDQDIEETKRSIETVKNIIKKAKNDIKEKVKETKAKMADIRASKKSQATKTKLIQELKDNFKNFQQEEANHIDEYESDLRNFEARLQVLETRKTEGPSPTARRAAPKKTTETAPAKTEKEIKAEKELDEEMSNTQAQIDDANEKIAEIKEEIEIEKSNTRDKIAEIKDKIAKIKETVTSKVTQKRLIQELKDELENFKETQENQIGIYNEDLAEQKAALRKAEAKFKKLEAKKAEMSPAPKTEKKTETKQESGKRKLITMAEVRERFPLAAAFIESTFGKQFQPDNAGVSGKIMQNTLVFAYDVMPKAKKAAVEFVKTLIEIEKLNEELDLNTKKVTKAEFKRQLAESGDFTVKQLRIYNALIDSIQSDTMPEYIITEEERKLLGKKSQNFFQNISNRIVSRSPKAFIHEMGHFSFFRVLTGVDRVKYYEYMINSTYGKTGTPLKERLAYTASSLWGIGPGDKTYSGTSNVANEFSEYFAEQFSQWYMNERLFPADIDTIFEKVAQFYSLVIEKLKSGKYVDKNLSEFFNKISVKIEQQKAENKKNKKATAVDPELADSVQELEDNLDLDFEDEFGLDGELSPMNNSFDSPLVAMAKKYNMKESGFFQNNVSTSHVNRDFYQFGLEAKQSAAGTYYLADIGTKKMVNPFKTRRGGNNGNSNMASKVVDINRKRETAKTNIKTKIGVAQALAADLNRLFSVNPRIIPDAVFDQYVALVDAFTGRKKVLTLPEIQATTAYTQAVLAALDATISQVEALAVRMDSYTNKVFDSNGNLDFDATITNMKDDGTVTEAEYKLLKKHKKRIVPKVSKPKMTAAEEKVIKDQLIKDIKSLVIKISGLATRFEKAAAKKFENLLTDDMLEKLSISRLSNILKLIDNINNGYFPHYAQLTINRLQGIKEAMNVSESIRKVNPLAVSKFISSIKAKLGKSDALYEMIKRVPTFYLDQAFGDFKSKTIYKAVFQPVASAYSSFKTSIDRVNDKLDRSRDRVAKSFKYNNNKILESSFKMMTYMIQLEFESNPASTQVNPAAEYLKATIDKRNSIYKEAEVKMLQDILNEYGVVIGQDKNGNDIIGIDNKALYDSFNKEEKAALKTIRDINDGMTEMAQYTASVIRGQSISPLNNYVHLRVMMDMDPESAASATILQNTYNNSLRPSTRAKNLEERTKGAKAINFDVFASAQTGAKSTLLDFHMTDAIRTVRGTLSETARMLEEGPKITAEQKEAFAAVEKIFEEVLKNVLTNSFSVDSFWEMVGSEITKQGYRAVLTSTSKFLAELLSNLSYVVMHPQEFTEGLKYIKTIRSAYAADIMMIVDSAVTSRVYSGETLSGRFVDTSAMSQSSGIKSGRALSPARNVANMVYNRSLKKYKNSVEIIADTLISSPDKLVMRPVWFGSFALEFKKQTGVAVDFDKIAANDEAYMEQNAEAITAARDFADEQAVLMGATNNPFMAITRGSATHDMGFWAKFYHNFNNYMTTFRVFEFNAARQGIYAAVGNGTMTKARGAALVAACITRMTSYNLLMGMFAGGLVGATATFFGVKKRDDDDDKTIGQKAAQSTIASILGLMVGRDFGNATTTIFNYQMEKANKNYLEFLRKEEVDPKTGEVSYKYDPYKDGIAYSILPGEDDPTDFGQMLVSLTGSTSPMWKTAKLAFEKWNEDPKKEPAAIERQKAEIRQRIPLEIVGNAGYVPLYKEFKILLNDLIYESLKEEKKIEEVKAKEAAREKKRLGIYESREDMERYDPVLYEKTFGPSSPDYAEDEAKRKAAKGLSEWKRSEKDKKYGYDPNKVPTKDEMSRSELKRYFPEEYDRKYGKSSPTYAEDEAEKAVTKYERDQRQNQLDSYYGYKTSARDKIKEQMREQKDKMRGQFNEMRAKMRRGL